MALLAAAALLGAVAPARAAHAHASLRFEDIAGHAYAAPGPAGARATLFFVVSCQCPVSNLYAPRIEEMASAYASKGIRSFLVYPDFEESLSAVRKNVRSHGLTIPAVHDSNATLSDELGATFTPEVIILDGSGAIRYRGRIDDNVVTTLVRHHDAEDALNAVLAGKPVPHSSSPGIGCIIRKARARTAAVAAGVPTYARDVAPILDAKCVGCHRTGQVAPFSLTDYEQASAWAPDIKRYTQLGQMPPWKPAPGYGDFVGEAEHTLTPRQKAILAEWADHGAPAGDLAHAPSVQPDRSGWALGKPDMVLQPSGPFHIAADGSDIYRDFVLPTHFQQDMWARAVEVHPGNRAVVHHVILYVDGMRLATKLDGKDHDGQPGFTAFGGPGFLPTGMLGGWAPGNEPVLLPDGVAARIPAHSNLVIQVHYHKNGKPEIDLTRIGLYFARGTVQKEARTVYAINFLFRIPPGDPHHVVTASIQIPRDSHILTVMPHMHLLGRQMKLWATLPDGEDVPLVWIKNWDFNWQETYVLAHPLAAPKGTVIHLWSVYDNSADNPNNPHRLHPRSVGWGEQTTDEMCIAFLTLTRDDEHLNTVAPPPPSETAMK